MGSDLDDCHDYHKNITGDIDRLAWFKGLGNSTMARTMADGISIERGVHGI